MIGRERRIPGAQVTLRNLATNQTRSATSESDGSYRMVALPVGDYAVRVNTQGFTSYLNPAITLAIGQTATLNVNLQPGGVSGEVTVTDKPPAIDPSSTISTTAIDPERIAELPVSSRNYLEFTLLAPGVGAGRWTVANWRWLTRLAARRQWIYVWRLALAQQFDCD